MKDNRSHLNIKIAALQRYVLWHYGHKLTDNIRVTEYPKSGGTWLCQMLGALLDLPFPRNRPMTWNKGIFHSHYPGPIEHAKTILLVRDGRDVIVSAYYHFIIGHNRNPSFLTDEWRKRLGVSDYQDIEKYLPKFIDIFFSQFKVGWRIMNWPDYINSFDLENSNLYLIKYEDLLTDCFTSMRDVLQWLNHPEISEPKIQAVVEEYSFKKISGRAQGNEDDSQFLRKGIAGDWKNKFNQEAIDRFDNWARPQLNLLGYE